MRRLVGAVTEEVDSGPRVLHRLRRLKRKESLVLDHEKSRWQEQMPESRSSTCSRGVKEAI